MQHLIQSLQSADQYPRFGYSHLRALSHSSSKQRMCQRQGRVSASSARQGSSPPIGQSLFPAHVTEFPALTASQLCWISNNTPPFCTLFLCNHLFDSIHYLRLCIRLLQPTPNQSVHQHNSSRILSISHPSQSATMSPGSCPKCGAASSGSKSCSSCGAVGLPARMKSQPTLTLADLPQLSRSIDVIAP